MNKKQNMPLSKRLNKKAILFEILHEEPDIKVAKLIRKAKEAGITLTTIGAYRTLRSYRESGGKLENSETEKVKAVASCLQNAQEGEHLNAAEIEKRALQYGLTLHQATIYRILARLTAIGLVRTIKYGRQKFYEWRSGEAHHGHLKCIQCGHTIEFSQDILDELGRHICRTQQFEFNYVDCTLLALCKNCKIS